MNTTMKLLGAGLATVALGGCFNLATKPSEIAPAYVPTAKYADYNCQSMAAEMVNLSRRKTILVEAQKQRRSSSKVQAFWLGYGNGDGVAAGQLAYVKGDLLALQKQQRKQGCETGE